MHKFTDTKAYFVESNFHTRGNSKLVEGAATRNESE